MSNNFTSHFSADDAALVLIDFQPQMFMGVEYPVHQREGIRHALIGSRSKGPTRNQTISRRTRMSKTGTKKTRPRIAHGCRPKFYTRFSKR